jgi:hypothetical protein
VEEDMNIQASHGASNNDDRLVYWIGATLLLMYFGVGDAAIIAWSASLATVGQLATALVAFILTGMGLLYTVWLMRR